MLLASMKPWTTSISRCSFSLLPSPFGDTFVMSQSVFHIFGKLFACTRCPWSFVVSQAEVSDLQVCLRRVRNILNQQASVSQMQVCQTCFRNALNSFDLCHPGQKTKSNSSCFPTAGWASSFRMFGINFDFVSLWPLCKVPHRISWRVFLANGFPNAGWHTLSPGTPRNCGIDRHLWALSHWQTLVRHKIERSWSRFHCGRVRRTTFLRPFRHHSLLSVRKKEMAAGWNVVSLIMF